MASSPFPRGSALRKNTGGIAMTDMTASDPSHKKPSSERTNQEFERLAGPFRREIKVHCYRMLGSLHEADDLVQENSQVGIQPNLCRLRHGYPANMIVNLLGHAVRFVLVVAKLGRPLQIPAERFMVMEVGIAGRH